MLARKRTTVADYQIGGAFNKLRVFSNAVFTLKIETDAHVNAAVTEVPVKRSSIAVFVHQLANIAQIATQLFRSYSGVIPSFPFGHRTRRKSCRTGTRFAQMPDVAGFFFCVQPRRW